MSALFVVPATALGSHGGCHTKQCVKRVKIHKTHPMCNTYKCQARVDRKRRAREWRYWTRLYIPRCTWYGESGPGAEFAKWRYSVMNTGGSGARGKFQFMPGTYHAFAKYHDWSPLDQEIAARRLFSAQGTSPWSACH